MARLWFAIAAVVGALAAGSAIVVLLTSPAPAAFGWVAYAPLSDTAYAPPPAHPWAALLVLAGGCALLGAGATGVLLLRRPPIFG